MKKKILLLMGVFSIGIAIHAQIGINTDTPLALFHIDAKRNTISASAGVDDDLVVNNVGNLGLGTTTPPNKVSVYSSGTDTGCICLTEQNRGTHYHQTSPVMQYGRKVKYNIKQ